MKSTALGWEVTHAGSQSAARLVRWIVSLCRFLLGRLRADDVGLGAEQLPSSPRRHIALRAGRRPLSSARQGPALDKGPWRYCILMNQYSKIRIFIILQLFLLF